MSRTTEEEVAVYRRVMGLDRLRVYQVRGKYSLVMPELVKWGCKWVDNKLLTPPMKGDDPFVKFIKDNEGLNIVEHKP